VKKKGKLTLMEGSGDDPRNGHSKSRKKVPSGQGGKAQGAEELFYRSWERTHRVKKD